MNPPDQPKPVKASDYPWPFPIKSDLTPTPTPRTDAIAHRGYSEPTYIAWMTDFARTLERELAAANKRIADCEFLLEHRYKIIQQQEPRCNEAIARAEKAEAELANIANAKPDTWGDMSDSFQAWAQNRARHALAAMKGTP